MDAASPIIRGAGGKGGAGATEAADSLRSTQTADILDLLSEGEVEGLVNGLKSIYLDGVPLQNTDGSMNFEGVQVAFTAGTQGQAAIAGTDGVTNEIGVAVAVLAAAPLVRTITNPAIDDARVTIAVNQLTQLDADSGDLKGSSFEWAIEVQSAGGGFVEVMRETVSGKTTSRYTRAKRFPLAGAAPWDIRVKRLSVDSASSAMVNAFDWASYAEIQNLKLRYPNSALARVRVGAQQFGRIPVRGYDLLGIRVQVPTNYDPRSRIYTGVWNGSFKIAWTDNPAWIYHDMVANDRYGLGRYITRTDAFKWELYSIGRYCDGMVPDGYGGIEPRFRCGLYLANAEQAYKVLTDLAAIFRGMAYWSNTDVAVVQDAPSDPVALFTPSNVVGAAFTYAGASASKRHSSVVVWFNDLAQLGKLVPEVVVDRELEARYGVRALEVSPLGVWSRGQAQRIGKWVIYSEQQETQTVVFRVGLDGVLVPPGKVFQIADPNEAGERLGGRVRSATTTHVQLDAQVTLAAGEAYTLTAMLPDPSDAAKLTTQQRPVTTAAGVVGALDVNPAFTAAPAVASVWLLQSTGVQATTWRCIGVKEVDGSNEFEISALEHAPQKFDLIEQGIAFERPSISRILLTPPAPTLLAFTETVYLAGAIARSRETVSWRAPAPGLTYLFSWRLNDGQWTDEAPLSANSIDLDVLGKGALDVSVKSRNALGNLSAALTGSSTIHGKTARPSNVAAFAAAVVPGGVRFTWTACPDDDYLATTLKIAGVTLFEGNASSFTWPWPALGTYTVTATHFDTSLNESAVPASVTVAVDEAMEIQWADVAGRPLDLFNMVVTPQFEGGDKRGWSEAAGVVAVSGQPWHHALQIVGRDTYDHDADTPVRGGETLYGVADIDASTAAYTVSFGAYFADANGAPINWIAAGGVAPGTGWTRVGGRITVPANAVTMTPWLQIAGSSGFGTGRATNLYLGRAEPGATLGADWAANVANIPYASVYNNDDSVVLGFSMEDWPPGQALPTGWTYWGGPVAPTRETTILRAGNTSVRWAVAGGDIGMVRTSTFGSAPLPLGTFLSGSVDLYLVARTLGLPGVLVRVFTDAGFAGYREVFVTPPSTALGAWQRVPWTLRAAAGDRIYGIQVYTMASPDSRAADFVGDVVFDNFIFALYDSSIDNTAITLQPDGTATGGVSGQVTITGLGYSGSLDATTDLVLVARGNCVLKGNQATKVGGAAAWNSDVYSLDSYKGGAFASAVPVRADRDFMFGLNSDPLSDASYASLDYAFLCLDNSDLRAYQSGVDQGVIGTYAAGDVLLMVYNGYTVQWLKNGTLLRITGAAAGVSLFWDSSFFNDGASARNIRFGPLSAVSEISTGQIAANAATEVYRSYVAGPVIYSTVS